MPLERLFDYCGEQMAFYCGKDLSDLIIITLNKYVSLLLLFQHSTSSEESSIVEATLAIILLVKNQ